MAEFRMWKTITWRQDVYFGELKPTAALLYLYLYLNEDIEYYGVLRYDLGKIAEDVNLEEKKVNAILEKFRNDGKIIRQERSLFVKGFMTMQGRINKKTRNKIRADAYKLPAKIQEAIEKEISTLKETSGNKRVVEKPEIEPETESAFTRVASALSAEAAKPNYLNLEKIIRDEWYDVFDERLDMDDDKTYDDVEKAVTMIHDYGKKWDLEILDLSELARQLICCIKDFEEWTTIENFKPSTGHLCSKKIWGLMKNWCTEKGLLR